MPNRILHEGLRDFRKDRYGNQNVEKRNTGGGVWEYRMPDGWV